MLEHIEKIKKEINEKTNATIDDIMNTSKDIEQLNEDLRAIQNHYEGYPKMDDIQNIAQQVREINSESEVRLNNAIQALRIEFEKQQEERVHDIEFSINNKIMSRIENVERTVESTSRELDKSGSGTMKLEERLTKVEDTMKMNYNVISQLNEKVNRHINLFDNTKQMLLEKINKLETQQINRELDQNPLNNFNFPAHEESLKKLEDAVEQLENDIDLLKDRTGAQIQEEVRTI